MREDMRSNVSGYRPLRGQLGNAGREGIFRRMAEQHGAALRRSALARGSSIADAADLVQEVFEKALRARPPVRDDNELRGWLLVVLRHLSVDKKRAVAARCTIPYDVLAIRAPEPEAVPLWRQIEIEVVYAVLPRVSLPLRRTFELRLAGHSTRHIAQCLGIPEATVGVQLHRARLRLKKLVLAHYQGGRLQSEEERSPRRLVPSAVAPSNDIYQGGIEVPVLGNREQQTANTKVPKSVGRRAGDVRGGNTTGRRMPRALPGSI